MNLPNLFWGLLAKLFRRHEMLALLLVLNYSLEASAQTREWTDREALVKAAMLLNFSRFTYYPEPDGALSICILGNNPFGEALESIKDKRVGDRNVEVLVIPDVRAPIEQCSLVFVSDGLKDQLPLVLEQLQGWPVLTVAEMDGFNKAGGMINLINLGSTTRFQINRKHIENTGLRMSSRVLAIATLVDD